MVSLSKYNNLSIYNSEGNLVGRIEEVILNLKKGRISYFKTIVQSQDDINDNDNDPLKTLFKNPLSFLQAEESNNPPVKENIVYIPYDVVTAVGDVMLIDQEKLTKHQLMKNNKVKKTPTI
ncbi:MAG: hypothetical protein BZ137_04630 [Methanosphaera sp. rholeuAM130]|nr:PRC-barrel domain-containing protein [Methanosphaera sp.]RAP53995.1 MAG: hypothetical protein BZ137_04630 [Methanosphaera sp. rholeuAM130]